MPLPAGVPAGTSHPYHRQEESHYGIHIFQSH